MGTNGPDDAAAVCGAACGASGQRGTGRTCRATASSEQTNAPPRGDRQPAKHPQLHGEKNVRKGADGQPNAGQDDILRVKGATQPGRSRLVADGAGYQCGGNAWTRGWWHRPTPRQRSTSIWHRPLLGRWKANPPPVGTKKSTATVVIDLDAWLRAIPASICALLVAGERAGQPACMARPEPTGGKWQNFKHLG